MEGRSRMAHQNWCRPGRGLPFPRCQRDTQPAPGSDPPLLNDKHLHKDNQDGRKFSRASKNVWESPACTSSRVEIAPTLSREICGLTHKAKVSPSYGNVRAKIRYKSLKQRLSWVGQLDGSRVAEGDCSETFMGQKLHRGSILKRHEDCDEYVQREEFYARRSVLLFMSRSRSTQELSYTEICLPSTTKPILVFELSDLPLTIFIVISSVEHGAQRNVWLP
jgi:hypothetical protein